MAKQQLFNTFKTNVEQLTAIDIEALRNNLGGPYAEHNHHNIDDLFGDFDTVLSTFNDLKNQEELTLKLPVNIFNTIVNSSGAIFNHINSFAVNKQQAHFNNAVNQVANAHTQLFQWGLLENVGIIAAISNAKSTIETTQASLTENSRKATELANQLDILVSPAVSSSLAKAFGDRADKLEAYERNWFLLSLAASAIAVVATVVIGFQLWGLVNQKTPTGVINNGSPWALFLLRSLVLVPTYFVTGFAFKRLSMERSYEEEYRHKASVATALPNYADLATDASVKDAILSNAADVIFKLPGQKTKLKQSESDIEGGIKIVKELVGVITPGKST